MAPCRTLRSTVSLCLFVALAVAVLPFSLLVARFARDDLQSATSRHVVQIAETVIRSTRLAMLLNDRDAVTQIISDISRQPGIERLRVIDSQGQIIDSNLLSEVGMSVDKTEEPCVNCHRGDVPLAHVLPEQHWRIVGNGNGDRSIVAMEVIRNEPTCANASCHAHPASQQVLGLVDIAYSLREVDASIASHTAWIVGLWLAFVLLVASAAGWLLRRKVYLPLRDLAVAADRIGNGDLDHTVPVRGQDEFAGVATVFNSMGLALKQSRQATQDLIQTLEARVDERSRQLLEARSEAAHGEKLAAIGMLASGIAHELNNPLTGVLTFTTLLRKKAADGTQDAEDLDLVIRETKRCAGIIRRLLDFAREKVPVKGLFDLNRLVEETVRFVERSASLERIEITTDVDPQLPQVFGDADLIKQVVLNVLVNARQAIDGPGRIGVATRRLQPRSGAAGGGGDAPVEVEVSISDSGCGIAPDVLPHIFDPFFTTKDVGHGTGLGLSVSYGIVRSHDGTIVVDSQVGEGSTFRIRLPARPPNLPPTTAKDTDIHERAHSGH